MQAGCAPALGCEGVAGKQLQRWGVRAWPAIQKKAALGCEGVAGKAVLPRLQHVGGDDDYNDDGDDGHDVEFKSL